MFGMASSRHHDVVIASSSTGATVELVTLKAVKVQMVESTQLSLARRHEGLKNVEMPHHTELHVKSINIYLMCHIATHWTQGNRV